MKALLLSIGILCLNNLAQATITSGAPLPSLSIENKGELVLQGDTVTYQHWSTAALTGKVQVLQYMAGRMAASKLNEPFTDQLKTRGFPLDKYHVTTIINLSDAFFGTSGFVNSELKSNKKKYPKSSIVADKSGLGATLWGLKRQSSAIFVLSPTGEVLFFKDGALSAEEIDNVLALIQQQIEQLEGEPLKTGQLVNIN